MVTVIDQCIILCIVCLCGSFAFDVWTMACERSHDSDMEITYRSRICPHPAYKFDTDNSKKRGRARVLLHKILGWESGYYVCKEVRHHMIAHVKKNIMIFTGFLITWMNSGSIKIRFPTGTMKMLQVRVDSSTSAKKWMRNFRPSPSVSFACGCSNAVILVYKLVSLYRVVKKDPNAWVRFRRCNQCLSQFEESNERCDGFDRTTWSVDSCQVFAPIVWYSRKKQETTIWQLTVHVWRHLCYTWRGRLMGKKIRRLKRKIRLQASEHAQDIQKYESIIEELKFQVWR